MTDIERRIALLRSRSLMVPTTDPATSKRPAEDPSSKPSFKKTKHTTPKFKPRTNLLQKRQPHALTIMQRELLRSQAELQKTKQELAAQQAKSLQDTNEHRRQIELLCTQCRNLTDRSNAILARNATLQAAHHDLTSELRAHKGALDLTREELEESRKDAETFRKAMLKQDEDHKLVREQLKEAKEDEVVQWKMLTNRLQSLRNSRKMGRAVYDMLLLQVEEQYGEDEVVLERVKEALKEALGGFFESE